jgi:hypothetical protein
MCLQKLVANEESHKHEKRRRSWNEKESDSGIDVRDDVGLPAGRMRNFQRTSSRGTKRQQDCGRTDGEGQRLW